MKPIISRNSKGHSAKSTDYIIVGAGSAGCVLANRLSEDHSVSVKLLELGPKDQSWMIQMPAAFSRPLMSNRFNWAYKTLPEPFMDNRIMDCPRGRVIGGSSSINGMCYVRGNAADYDRWADETSDPAWSYSHCLPYFKKANSLASRSTDYHGTDGPLTVTPGACENPLHQAFIEAGIQAGYGHTDDQNGYRQEGFGPMFMTIKNGVRWSAAKAYLNPALSRPNLDVVRHALVTRILFDKTRSIGVEILIAGKVQTLYCEREVIVCGGSINSPQLLNLSGIGNPEHLKKIGVPCVIDLPGVGENLQDHLEAYLQHSCKQPISIYPALKFHTQARVFLQWIVRHRGWGASNHFESGGFIRTRAGVRHPDIQYHFFPVAANYDGTAPVKGHGYQAHMGPMRPTSSGFVRTVSIDPRKPPEIQFNYMQTDQDRQEMRDGIRLTREIFAQKAFDPFRGPELAPGANATSDSELDAFVRAKAESAYHPSCTCKMGVDDMAVTDSEGKVRGAQNLRIVDASIMPSIPSGNLNAPVIMMAEKLADRIAGRSALEPSDAAVYEAVNWETGQRESEPETPFSAN